ncbi:MAG: DUF6483 family protein [Clostridia bacterium]
MLSFYDYLNGKKDEFLEKSGFSRDEILSGLEEALKRIGKEIPEYMRWLE